MRIMLEKSDRRVPEPASPIAPDCRGTNFYEIDAGLKQLLDLYVEPALRDHLEPHFERLGRLAGGSTSSRRSPTSIRPGSIRATATAGTRIGSSTIRPTAKWSGSASAIFSSTR